MEKNDNRNTYSPPNSKIDSNDPNDSNLGISQELSSSLVSSILRARPRRVSALKIGSKVFCSSCCFCLAILASFFSVRSLKICARAKQTKNI